MAGTYGGKGSAGNGWREHMAGKGWWEHMEGKELAGKYLRKGLCNFFSLQNGYTTFVSHNKKPFSAYSKQKSATMQLRSPVHAKRWGPGTLRPTVDQRVLFGLWEAEESFSA